jgi:type VI secretion system secreted protein VgrG
MSDAQDCIAIRLHGSELPEDARLHRFRGRERLGRAFKFSIGFSSAKADLSADKLLGSPVTVTLKGEHGDRIFNGVVARFSFLDPGDLSRDHIPVRTWYRAVIRPHLWRLTRSSHSRFFYGKNVLDIAKLLLDEQEVDYRIACTADYPKWDNCTQYRETDFDFLNRLLQREGIYYYFEHTGEADRLVLVDDPQEHGPIPGYAEIPFNAVLDQHRMPIGEVVYRWKFDRRVVPGKSEANAFDFRNVARSTNQGLLARATAAQQEGRSYVIEDPALWHVDEADGRRYAQGRLDAHLGRAARVVGRTSAGGIWPGGRFRLTGHPYANQNGEYLVIEARYRMNADASVVDLSSKHRRKSSLFDCTFRAIPKGGRYRGSRWTPAPHVGPQTAIVVAPDGDDYATDSYGRVKVQFHWEQFNPVGASQRMQRCWVRVAQPWAGKGWGAMFLPRAGQEVLVDFLGGDPDHPVVVGALYNSSNPTPYTLPDAGAVSTIRTSAVDSSEQKRNELRFNDRDTQVLVYTDGHYDTYVKGDGLTWVGKDAHSIVQKRHLIKVGSQHITVQEGQMTKVGQSVSLHAGLNVNHKADQNYVVEGLFAHIKATEVVIEASAQLSLKAGGSFVTIGPAGVQISGVQVMLNSGGAAGAGPGGSPASPDQPEQADDGSSVK